MSKIITLFAIGFYYTVGTVSVQHPIHDVVDYGINTVRYADKSGNHILLLSSSGGSQDLKKTPAAALSI